MRLLLEKDDGAVVEIRAIEGVPSDTNLLLMQTAFVMSARDTIALENKLTEKTGFTCVILPRAIDKVIGIPEKV